MNKLKIGILHQGDKASWNQGEIISWLTEHPDFEIHHIELRNREGLVDRFSRKLKDKGPFKLLSQLFLVCYEHIERSLFKRLSRKKFDSYLMDEFAFSSIITAGLVMRPNNRCYVEPADCEQIKSMQFDYLLRSGGGGIFTGEILYAAIGGILSFHHGDNRWNRGGPPGFWEVLNRVPITGFIIQQLNDELDGGRVLFRSSIRTKRFYIQNQYEVFKVANIELKRVLTKLLKDRSLENYALEEPLIFDHKILTAPSARYLLFYIYRVLSGAMAAAFKRLILRRPHSWQVGYQLNSWKGVSLSRSKYLIQPKDRFYADPFIVNCKDDYFIFYEECIYKTGIGVISCSQVDSSGEIHKYTDIIPGHGHKSFPFIFSVDDKFYMCPETRDQHKLMLYECIEFPNVWRWSKDILTDVDAVDPLIFCQNGYWWLFTTIASDRSLKADTKLHVFYSDDPLNGLWVEHPKSPIIEDSLSGRNGGLLYCDGEIYRVSQKPGFNQYGRSCELWKVECFVSDILITKVQEVNPFFKAKAKGIHHLYGDNNCFSFDVEHH